MAGNAPQKTQDGGGVFQSLQKRLSVTILWLCLIAPWPLQAALHSEKVSPAPSSGRSISLPALDLSLSPEKNLGDTQKAGTRRKRRSSSVKPPHKAVTKPPHKAVTKPPRKILARQSNHGRRVSEYRLKRMEVGALGRLSQEGRSDSSAFATVIRQKDYRFRAAGLTDLLRESVGVLPSSYGGIGNFGSISIRGSSAQQVTVLLDGIPLNRAQGGGIDLADLPLDSLERIEIYRGMSPARLAQAGMGGVINVITKKPSRAGETIFSLKAGSFGTADITLSRSGSFSGGDYLFSVNLKCSDGDFLYLDNNGTEKNPRDDEIKERQNNRYFISHMLAKASYRLRPGMILRIMNDFLGRYNGVPGIDAMQSEQAKFSTFRDILRLELELKNLGGWGLNLNTVAFFILAKDSFNDPDGEIALSPHSTDNTFLTGGGLLKAAFSIGKHNNLTALLSLRHEGTTLKDYATTPVDRGGGGRTHLSLALEDEISLWGRRLIFNPSVRYDGIFNSARVLNLFFPNQETEQDHQIFVWKAGFRLRPLPFLALQANVGRFFRPPSLWELYGDSGAVIGNSTLKSESGLNFDAGFSLHFRKLGIADRLYLQAAYFYRGTNNLIAFIRNSQATIVAYNRDRARIQGLELAADVRLFGHLSLGGSYTFQRVEDRSAGSFTGKLIPGRPVHKLVARLTVHGTFWRVFYGLVLIDENYLDMLNKITLPTKVLHNLGASVQLWKRLRFTLEILNLTDDRTVDLYRFPLPGLTLFVKLTARI